MSNKQLRTRIQLNAIRNVLGNRKWHKPNSSSSITTNKYMHTNPCTTNGTEPLLETTAKKEEKCP
jgi:hypothetical protein